MASCARCSCDCAPQEYCDAFNTVCVPDLANGRQIPADVLHNGLCSANVAAAVCVSGNCNPSTQACAAALGAGCTMAADCADNVCGSNGECGGAAGQGPCTVQNQTTTCQSGTCSQNGTCLAAGGCSVDADCLPNRYCDGAAKTSSTRLPPGTPSHNVSVALAAGARLCNRSLVIGPELFMNTAARGHCSRERHRLAGNPEKLVREASSRGLPSQPKRRGALRRPCTFNALAEAGAT